MVKEKKHHLKPGVLSKIKTSYDVEFEFITNLFAKINIPSQDDSSDSENEQSSTTKDDKDKPQNPGKTVRARTMEELHERLVKLQDSKYTYKSNLLKKRLKSKLKKKKKIMENRKNKLWNAKSNRRIVKTASSITGRNIIAKKNRAIKVKTEEAAFNRERNLVVSKLELMGETSTINDRKILKHDRNPKEILKKIEKRENFIKKLEQTGDKETANILREQTAWKNALKKAEGLKVKDDPTILKKTLRKKEAKKKVSQKKWQTRLTTVERERAEKQKKRNENLAKRKQENRKNKIKKAQKKGRFVSKTK